MSSIIPYIIKKKQEESQYDKRLQLHVWEYPEDHLNDKGELKERSKDSSDQYDIDFVVDFNIIKN
jgi:hypothetical protein